MIYYTVFANFDLFPAFTALYPAKPQDWAAIRINQPNCGQSAQCWAIATTTRLLNMPGSQYPTDYEPTGRNSPDAKAERLLYKLFG